MPLTVAYPGRDGAHSAVACERLFPDAERLALPSFSAVAEAASTGTVEFGVLPIESSLAGPVTETQDLLHESPLAITAEAVLAIRHCLVGVASARVEDIRVVRSHPSAFEQCRGLLGSLPGATAVAAATTADAAAEVAERANPAEAAIASERAAELCGLSVIASNVGDREAYTRFVSVATHLRLDRAGAHWRTAFSFVTDHQPGALHRAIEPFARHGVDLVQLLSRPIANSPWRYRFDAVLDGHPLDPFVREALADLRARTRRLSVFGSYPAAAR